MSDRVEYFACQIPAGTPKANPVRIKTPFPQGNVVEIDVRIPGGPVGLMGFQIMAGGAQYVPRTLGAFIVEDDRYLEFPQDTAINSGDWSIIGYNTGSFPHTVYVTFKINELPDTQASGSYVPGASSGAIPTATAGL